MILSGCSGHHLCSSSIIPHSPKTLRGEEEVLMIALLYFFSMNVKLLGGKCEPDELSQNQ